MRLGDILFSEHRNPAAEKQVVAELQAIHGKLRIPLQFRIYWPRPEVMAAAGIAYPSWVKQPGWDMRHFPLPRNVRAAQSGSLGIEYIVGTQREAGWLWLLGHDDIGRRAVVVAVPPEHSKSYIASITGRPLITPPPPPRRA